MNYFINGMEHPFAAPTHLLLIVAMALLLGQQDQKARWRALAIFIVSVCIGLLATHAIPTLPQQSIILLSVTLVLSVLTALYLTLPIHLTSLLALIAGFLLGLDSEPLIIPGFTATKIYSTLGGTALSISALLVIISLLASLLQRFWEGVLIRALSSWIIASSMMVLVLAWTKTINI